MQRVCRGKTQSFVKRDGHQQVARRESEIRFEIAFSHLSAIVCIYNAAPGIKLTYCIGYVQPLFPYGRTVPRKGVTTKESCRFDRRSFLFVRALARTSPGTSR